MLNLTWIGSSKEDLKAMPEKIRKSIGYALRVAQLGGRPEGSKPLSGFGSSLFSTYFIKNRRTAKRRLAKIWK